MSEELKPITDEHWCDSNCPFLDTWEHPYFHHSGWCWKQMRELHWYDYHLADCIDNEPNKKLSQHKESGRGFEAWNTRTNNPIRQE